MKFTNFGNAKVILPAPSFGQQFQITNLGTGIVTIEGGSIDGLVTLFVPSGRAVVVFPDASLWRAVWIKLPLWKRIWYFLKGLA